MKKICIIGNGYVGAAMIRLLEKQYLITIKEIDDNYDNVNNSDLTIICVPTNQLENGLCDISIVEKVIKESNAPLYLIKSAIPPKTTEYLIKKYNKRIVVSPEYIGEGKYPTPYWKGIPHPTDMSIHDFQIFGGNKEDTGAVIDFFLPVLGPYCRYYQTDSRSAELVKYMENSFLATKIVFCHEFSRIVENFDRDYKEIRELFVADRRVEKGSTAVFKNKLGYGGKCLPKDISGIYYAAKENGFESKFLKQVIDTNEDLKNNNE